MSPAPAATAADATLGPVDVVHALPVYWMTRDKIGGVLMDVDVWAIAPERVAHADGDVSWLEPEVAELVRGRITRGVNTIHVLDASLYVDEHETCVDSWTVAEARKRHGNGIPENDRESVRVGEEPAIDRSLLS